MPVLTKKELKVIKPMIGRLEEMRAEVETIRDRVQEKIDNASDKWREGEKGDEHTTVASTLDDIATEMDNIFGALEGLVNE